VAGFCADPHVALFARHYCNASSMAPFLPFWIPTFLDNGLQQRLAAVSSAPVAHEPEAKRLAQAFQG